MKNALVFITVVVLAGYIGYRFQEYLRYQDIKPGDVKTIVIGNERAEFAMQDLDGNTHNIKEWDGKIIVLNFWATWCPPCMKEIPALIEIQEDFADQDLQIIGIALDDEDDVQGFYDSMGINYPVFATGIEGIDLSNKYGNRTGTIPFTAFINPNSIVTHTHAGEINRNLVEKILKEIKAGQ